VGAAGPDGAVAAVVGAEATKDQPGDTDAGGRKRVAGSALGAWWSVMSRGTRNTPKDRTQKRQRAK
jgi:hypothetical protein